MGSGDEKKSSDFYSVLGLQKECTSTDLKNAYKKLAMRWHPDRCSASGNSKFVEEAKKKFQDIQHAYSVLSDETKRFLYDVGVYDNDDDENNQGMGEFLNEMVSVMSENKPSDNGEESFEQLKELFDEMFQTGAHHEAFASTSQGSSFSSCSSSTYVGSIESSCLNNNNKRSSSEMNNAKGSSSVSAQYTGVMLIQAEQQKGDALETKGSGTHQQADSSNSNSNNSRRRQGRKQKISSAYDVSSNDYNGISA